MHFQVISMATTYISQGELTDFEYIGTGWTDFIERKIYYFKRPGMFILCQSQLPYLQIGGGTNRSQRWSQLGRRKIEIDASLHLSYCFPLFITIRWSSQDSSTSFRGRWWRERWDQTHFTLQKDSQAWRYAPKIKSLLTMSQRSSLFISFTI